MLLRVLLAALVGGSVAHAAKFRIRYVTEAGSRYLFLRDVARYYGMRYSHHTASKQVYLVSRYSRLLFKIDSRDSTLNNVSVALGLPVRTWKGNPILSDADFRLLLDPILRYRSLPQSTVKRIIIDPGHGGKDPGTHGKILKKKEKDIVLALAKQLYSELKQRGYEVHFTRATDKAVSLSGRPAVAERLQADLFVSLHANYVETSSVAGVECFRLCPKGTTSTYGNNTNGKTRTGNACDRRNTRLAYEIQKALVETSKATDRGVKQASFAVLRDACCPAVLVEVGYMSNAREEKLLASPAYRAKLARGIAEGIASYHRAVAHQP
jgi:N-acetylmuramoyl-L-alanine amidase